MSGSKNALFIDIFRRADQNDDQQLSKEEFSSYFGDGALSSEELKTLFDRVDTDKSGNIEVEELIAFFSSGFDHFMELFLTINSTNIAVSNALRITAETYEKAEYSDQFKMRFYLQESMNQLQSVYLPLQIAMTHLQENARGSSEGRPPQGTNTIHPKKHNDQSSQDHPLEAQVSKLAELVDKLSGSKLRVKLDTNFDESVEGLSLTSRTFHVEDGQVEAFFQKGKGYIKKLKNIPGCKHSYVKKMGPVLFVIYEVWESEEHLRIHYSSAAFRDFSRSMIDLLVEPSETRNMLIPSDWFED